MLYLKQKNRGEFHMKLRFLGSGSSALDVNNDCHAF